MRNQYCGKHNGSWSFPSAALLLCVAVIVMSTSTTTTVRAQTDAPTMVPTSKPSFNPFIEHQGPGRMVCVDPEDSCSFTGCELSEKGTLDRRSATGSEGHQEFDVFNNCTLSCTAKCTFTPKKDDDSAAGSVAYAVAGVVASLLAIMPMM
mmetsp:Transcript_20857/g.57990  ORF Transcript_20857/g.57990 Transcript_20857/m.57990 type:complete len:150 (-) Transcript_20857:542-991(-)|eukprot:CAMPEP_0198108968 /NCGR_PEP_ID=MMETSP1442-20131203/982_1 /TAXON_ID= /ORGANISM="Craspedostauros australis, Strain CCMP3328" /LENGTH=149 /DNA_ID=CAMNT_0043764397 /DNA_START=219 /DNA_END=668 /DNA_ORIENTATION=+